MVGSAAGVSRDQAGLEDAGLGVAAFEAEAVEEAHCLDFLPFRSSTVVKSCGSGDGILESKLAR